MSMKSHGFRSKLELGIAQQLVKHQVPFEYEEHSFEYYVNVRKYTPDFLLFPNRRRKKFFIEVKGYFTVKDRMKHLYIQKQHPDVDIRFLFGNAQNKIRKDSKTTYAQWCDKHGFKWAEGVIPKEWLK